ncbi:hypothetical protein CDAR_47291 [Caerostris darwini]|uniref:Uncharacterized protein n=1 Tax=Caerostris darwini TaxID=1538125 RepID=A0AAV4VHB3_9ARAC|nr:hypothetical protein CDAR_47291 [Caerostris darwini]
MPVSETALEQKKQRKRIHSCTVPLSEPCLNMQPIPQTTKTKRPTLFPRSNHNDLHSATLPSCWGTTFCVPFTNRRRTKGPRNGGKTFQWNIGGLLSALPDLHARPESLVVGGGENLFCSGGSRRMSKLLSVRRKLAEDNFSIDVFVLIKVIAVAADNEKERVKQKVLIKLCCKFFNCFDADMTVLDIALLSLNDLLKTLCVI